MRYEIIKDQYSGTEISNDDYIASFAKGLSLLEVFGTERQKLNATQIAERTDMSRTAVRRYLKTLRFLGYLDGDDHYFWLTHKVLRFSSAYLSTSQLARICQPILNRLTELTAHCFSVAVLDEHEIVPIARSSTADADNLRSSPYGMHLGHRLPAHATSTGKVLLAALSAAAQQQWIDKYGLKRLTPYTLQQPEHFLNLLKKISSQDFCLSKEEHELGVIAIAVPMYNHQGQVIAALNCIAQSYRVQELELVQEILPLLRRTADELRSML